MLLCNIIVWFGHNFCLAGIRAKETRSPRRPSLLWPHGAHLSGWAHARADQTEGELFVNFSLGQWFTILYGNVQFWLLFSRSVEWILNSWLFMRSSPVMFQASYPVMTCLSPLVPCPTNEGTDPSLKWLYLVVTLVKELKGSLFCIAATGMAYWWCGSHLW